MFHRILTTSNKNKVEFISTSLMSKKIQNDKNLKFYTSIFQHYVDTIKLLKINGIFRC